MVAEPKPWRQDESLPAELRRAFEAATPPSPLPGAVLERVGLALGQAGSPIAGGQPRGHGSSPGPRWGRFSSASIKLGLAGAVALGGAWSAWKAGALDSPSPHPASLARPEALANEAHSLESVPPVPVSELASADLTPPEIHAPQAPLPPAAATHALHEKTAPATPARAGDDLAEQARLLGRARQALGTPNEDAERWLREYRTRFPQGQLQPESELIWLKLELKRGDLERARARVQRLERATAQPAIARRARKMLDEVAAE